MAKKKGLLASPLVSVEEQPYSIPENWCWTYIGRIASLIGGGTPSKTNPEYWNGAIPWASIKDMKGDRLKGTIDTITEKGMDNSSTNLCPKGNLILATRIEPGKTIIADIDTAINQDLKIVVSNLDSSFLHFYFLHSRTVLEQKSSGSTVLGITTENVLNTTFPLPPLPEQKRIVDRIESLFTKLDEAKDRAQAVVDGFELRKSAILHKAFTGELTERWRKEHGVHLSDWASITLAEIVSGFKYGTSEKSTYNNTGMPVLRIPNVGAGILDFEDMKYLEHNDVDETNQVHENDILIIRSNGSRDLVGKCAIVPALDRKFSYASFLIRISPSERVLPNYLAVYLNSTDARTQMFKKAKSSAGIHNINSQELGSITINVPTLYEQSAIINVLNNLLAKEQQAKEAAETVLSQIDTMKKAILARAFRGELGTNDPAEEWAGELVKAVL